MIDSKARQEQVLRKISKKLDKGFLLSKLYNDGYKDEVSILLNRGCVRKKKKPVRESKRILVITKIGLNYLGKK